MNIIKKTPILIKLLDKQQKKDNFKEVREVSPAVREVGMALGAEEESGGQGVNVQ
jgi:hypothetical protein